ncbi:glucosyltransferase domain-containing protein [Pseudomonas frederiksbergensis]|uniref:glucosyltransferase domain-containing protein n=1 Tax=Pseudomonas frederiksbergensis TaxID=104087 RepID=UPI003D01FC8E
MPREVQLFFLVAVLLHIVPLILADYLYIDDIWRAQYAGTEWKTSGRILTEWLYQGLSLTRGAPNLFPLPLIISAVVMSFALRSMVFSLFEKPTLPACFVVLPLWYSPFFLQNLSYQYDGPGMALGLAVTVYAVTYKHSSTINRVIVSGALLCAALSFYQILIDVYVGLCCVMLFNVIYGKADLRKVGAWVGEHFAKLMCGVIFYLASAYQFMTDERKKMLPLSAEGLDKLVATLKVVGERLSLFYSEGGVLLAWLLMILASVGFVRLLIVVFRTETPILQRVVLFALCVFVVGVVFISIPGIAVVFDYFNDGARLMLGFSSALVFVFFLSYKALMGIHWRVTLILAAPLITMLSLSYAYGHVVNAQKVLGASVAQMLTFEVSSNRELRGVERFNLVVINQSWLSAASGTTNLLPVLRYILNVDFLLLAETMPRYGVMNVFYMEKQDYLSVVDETKILPVVDGRFYRIYVIGRTGYVVLNIIKGGEHYN